MIKMIQILGTGMDIKDIKAKEKELQYVCEPSYFNYHFILFFLLKLGGLLPLFKILEFLFLGLYILYIHACSNGGFVFSQILF